MNKQTAEQTKLEAAEKLMASLAAMDAVAPAGFPSLWVLVSIAYEGTPQDEVPPAVREMQREVALARHTISKETSKRTMALLHASAPTK